MADTSRETNPFATRPGTTGLAVTPPPTSSNGLEFAERMRALQTTAPPKQYQPKQQPSSPKQYQPPHSYHNHNQNLQQQPYQIDTKQSEYYSNATVLDTINVSNQNLTSLDQVILGTTASHTLIAASNALLRLRPFPTMWTRHLNTLDLSNNRLVMLKPDTFKALRLLKVLNLSNNSLSTLPRLHTCDQLETLQASRNNLAQFDARALGLSSQTLLYLDLSENSLSVAPFVQDCTTLKELNIRMNLIPFLPQGFLNANTRLTTFRADVNAFSKLDDFIPGLINASQLTTIDVRNNPFVATVERRGSEYRSILFGAISSLKSIDGKLVTEKECTVGVQLLNNNNGNRNGSNNNTISSYDSLLNKVNGRSTLTLQQEQQQQQYQHHQQQQQQHHQQRRQLPPPSPAAGSLQAKQWALSMLQNQQKDATMRASSNVMYHNNNKGSPSIHQQQDPRFRNKRIQMQRLHRMTSTSNTTSSSSSPSRPRMNARIIDNAFPQTAASSSLGSSNSVPSQPLGTLVNVTKEVTRLRQEVSTMRKYVRHWILKESYLRVRSVIKIQSTVRGWSERRQLRKKSPLYRTQQRKRMRRILETQYIHSKNQNQKTYNDNATQGNVSSSSMSSSFSASTLGSHSSASTSAEAVFTTVCNMDPIVVRWLWSSDYPTLNDVTSGGYEDVTNVFVFPLKWNTKDVAATHIQRVVRGVFCRDRLRTALDMSWHAVVLQAWWRSVASRWPKIKREQARKERAREGMAKIDDVISLARLLHSTRKELEEEKRTRAAQTEAMEVLWREVHALKQERKLRIDNETNSNVNKLQSWWRGSKERKTMKSKINGIKKTRNNAAINIQKSIRGVVTRIRLNKQLRRKEREESRIVRLETQLEDLNGILRKLLVAEQQQQQQPQLRRRRRKVKQMTSNHSNQSNQSNHSTKSSTATMNEKATNIASNVTSNKSTLEAEVPQSHHTFFKKSRVAEPSAVGAVEDAYEDEEVGSGETDELNVKETTHHSSGKHVHKYHGHNKNHKHHHDDRGKHAQHHDATKQEELDAATEDW